MSDLIMIQPARVALADDVTGLEIQLGGTPRGLVILLADATMPQGEVLEVLNALALEGFESLMLEAVPGASALAQARAGARGWQNEQIGVIGVGLGATAALDLARHRCLGAAVSLSPRPDLTELEPDSALQTPWLGLFGAEGPVTAPERERLRSLLEAGSDVFSQVVAYPSVGEDFYRRSESGISFAASYDGWQRTVEWMLARVASRLTPLALAWRERDAASSS